MGLFDEAHRTPIIRSTGVSLTDYPIIRSIITSTSFHIRSSKLIIFMLTPARIIIFCPYIVIYKDNDLSIKKQKNTGLMGVPERFIFDVF